MSDTIETISPAAEAWISGNMDKAQELSQPIPDGAAHTPLAGDVPAYLKNHLAAQDLEQKRTAAPDVAQAETAMISHAATTLSELGHEGASLVEEWGGASSPGFKENFAYARAAFADVAKNRPDLIAKVDASGLGNDPAVLKILSKLGRQKAHTLGDRTVSNRFSSFDEPSRSLPSGNSAAQRELNTIFEQTPPGTAGYAKQSVQDRIRQLQEMIHGDGPVIGQGGRTA